ncbi:MAG: hypothetical protein JRH19_24095 [Deltaproteobacteria bacterium]|nr:hypothetical protein [Deltaproteobacteria bacterium]
MRRIDRQREIAASARTRPVLCALACAIAALVPLHTSAYPVAGEAPALVGLDPEKPMILPTTVQAAYNDDTMFFHIVWEGDPGDYHGHVQYTQGAWQREGFPRREAQSTIDNDPARGPTNRTSTIYESRVTFMVDDPNGPNAVPNFGKLGCFATCHDNSRAMPTWDPSTNLTKYLNDGTEGVLDLWHHRLARANPIGDSDDQHVTAIPDGGEVGGRFGDEGSSSWQVNNIVEGKPIYALDNEDSESGGLFAFPWDGLFTDPRHSYRKEDALENGAGPVVVGIDYSVAESREYVPSEGDTIPRRRLRTPTGSRGDITAFDTTYTPSQDDLLFGTIESNLQRLLDTGNADDTALAAGKVYNIAFAVHTGQVTVRDHYVGFAMTLSLGGGSADIEAVNVAGTGREVLPDFSDTETFPLTETNLFLPGIASLEFLTGDNEGLEYIDPVTDEPVDQVHGGASSLPGFSCGACHTVANSEMPAGFAGTMEDLIPQRGGVHTPTPIPAPEPSALLLQLAALGALVQLVRRRV